MVLTVNGKAKLVVQDAASYQKLLESRRPRVAPGARTVSPAAGIATGNWSGSGVSARAARMEPTGNGLPTACG